MKVEWTTELTDEFKALVADNPGMSYNTIAKLMSNKFGMKFTKNSVIGKARRLGMPQRDNPIVQDKPITIYDLEWGMCKWPFGDPYGRPPFIYCGKPTGDVGCSWCATHRKQAFNRSTYGSAMISRSFQSTPTVKGD